MHAPPVFLQVLENKGGSMRTWEGRNERWQGKNAMGAKVGAKGAAGPSFPTRRRERDEWAPVFRSGFAVPSVRGVCP